jgi:hypothetical protein
MKKLSDTLTLTKYKDTWWLYDKTRNMNLSMEAKTRDIAFIKTITYYQKRLLEVENEYKQLKSKVDIFLDYFEKN